MRTGKPSISPESIPDGVALTQFFAHHFPTFSPATRRSWMRAAAMFCRNCHEFGIRVGVKASMSSAEPWRFRASTTPSEPSLPTLSERDRWGDLAALLAEAFTATQRGDRFWFLREYVQDGHRFKALRPALWRLEVMALKTATHKWRRREESCLRSGPEFIVDRVGSFRVFRRVGEEVDVAMAALLPDPDRLLHTGERRSDRGSGCVSAKVFLAGRPYFLKRYDCRGSLYRLKNALRRSRAMRVWIGTWALLARGIAVPEPLVLLEERHGMLLGRSYILSAYHEGGERMMTLWSRAGGAERLRLLAQCAILLGRMHAMNMVHGDTNWDNILVCGPLAAPKLILVDLDGSRSLGRMTHRQALRDIHHFVRDLLRERNKGDQLLWFFLDRWARWLGPNQKRGAIPLGPIQQRYRGLK